MVVGFPLPSICRQKCSRRVASCRTLGYEGRYYHGVNAPCRTQGSASLDFRVPETSIQATMDKLADYIALALILAVALCLFGQHKLRTDVTALLVTLALILPWPHPDGQWRSLLTYQEGFSGSGSVAVVMVVSMFVFGAAIVRTGAAEFLGTRLFRWCARHELLLQAAVLMVTTATSMFVNDTTVVLIFMPLIVAVCKEKNLSPSR